MASLNTLRTKFGVVLSIIIGLALLAFILSLKTEMGFTGNDPRVGVINGEKINYSEYYDEYERIKTQNNVQESDEQQSAMLANAVWQSLITRYVLTPGFDLMGLRVTDPERMAMVSGQQPSQAFYNAFADPRTGQYNVEAVSQFLAQAETNSQAAQVWAQLNEQARLEREAQKFFGLVKGGVYVNSLEVAQGVEGANKTFSGKWAGKKYPGGPFPHAAKLSYIPEELSVIIHPVSNRVIHTAILQLPEIRDNILIAAILHAKSSRNRAERSEAKALI